jgi:hypothetical protein
VLQAASRASVTGKSSSKFSFFDATLKKNGNDKYNFKNIKI